jgi:hypothetical protein
MNIRLAEVWNLWFSTCVVCQRTAAEVVGDGDALTVHHSPEKATAERSRLVAVCDRCHRLITTVAARYRSGAYPA